MNKTSVKPSIRLVQHEDQRETFIPLRHDDMIRLLVQQLEWGEKEPVFSDLCVRLYNVFHAEHLSTLLAVETIYSPLDPDCELLKVGPNDELAIEQRTSRLFDSLGELLNSAHYQQISHDELLNAIQLSSQWGIKLDIDFSVFDRLEVYARGYRMVEVERRRWQKLYRKETIELPQFHRLMLAFRVNADFDSPQDLESGFVYLKIFKNIPESELEVLLPGTKVKLSPLDRGKIILPTISGAAPTIYKIYRGAIVIGLGLSLTNIYSAIIVLSAFVGYIAKSVLTYFRTKDKYQFELTKNLYVKNLDNNAGVLYRILNEAREQELCETILSYAMLWQHREKSGMASEKLDEIAEGFIEEHTGFDVNFEVHDAVAKLGRLGLATQDEQGNWIATPLDEASESLNENWTSLFHDRLDIISERYSDKPESYTDKQLDDNLFTSD